MHVPLQPLFIPCTWHTKSLLLHPTSCIQPCSYLYIALLVTTLFSALHPACTNSVTARDIQCYWVPAIFLIASIYTSAKYTPYIATLFFTFSYILYPT